MTGHHDDPEALKALSIELVSVSIEYIYKYLYKSSNDLFSPSTSTAGDKYGSWYHWFF